MRVIPVIDLKDGIVVRGVGGRRHEYQAVASILAAQPSPAAVATALVEKLGLRELYLADLDAIAGSPPSWAMYDELLALGTRLWLDAGIADLPQATQVAAHVGIQSSRHAPRAVDGTRSVPTTGGQLARLVVGLESLTDRASLRAMLDAVGPERLTLSIDLKLGQPLAADARWREVAPEQIAADALAVGVRSLIVLDLAYVGEGRGPGTSPLCAAIRRLDATLELVSGGGVRGLHDLKALAAAGCDAALVASALHDGRLTAADIEGFRGRQR